MTWAGVNMYMKVFMEVDSDRDGKITEILKQVLDLSKQDNDSMLSLRDCIALYLMERYRQGQNLPPKLPSNVLLLIQGEQGLIKGRCKKTVECVACLLGWWNRSRGQDDIKACGFDSVRLADERKRQKRMTLFHPYRHVYVINQRRIQDERKEIKATLFGGETTRCEHYGGGSSNRVALDVAKEEVVDPGNVRDGGRGSGRSQDGNEGERDRGSWKKLGSRSSRLRG
ncbi:epidermal growth factor receptor substrate 15-like protein 1 [Tanacetum coccineum]